MLLLIDCDQLCYRYIFVLKDLEFQHQSTGVIWGFMDDMLTLAETFKTNQFVFCWDSRRSRRELLFPAYKAKRKEKKKDMTQEEKLARMRGFKQMTQLRTETLPELGFKNIFQQGGIESDDLMAMFCKDYPDIPMTLVTTDNDMWQLLDSPDRQMFNLKKKALYTGDDFRAEWGIEPAQWADVKTIAGCSTDEVPGVPGVGSVKAIQYLKGEMNPKSKTFAKIKTFPKEPLELYEKLVKLPFAETNHYKFQQDVFTMEKFEVVCHQHGFRTFLATKTWRRWREAFDPQVRR